jgi:hypothetical protein
MKDCAVVLSLLTRPLTYPVNNNLPFKIPSVIIISDVSEPSSSCPSILYSIYVVITCNIHSVPTPPRLHCRVPQTTSHLPLCLLYEDRSQQTLVCSAWRLT